MMITKAEQAYWSARQNEYDTAVANNVPKDRIQDYIYENLIKNASIYADMFGVSEKDLLSFHKWVG